MTAPTDKELDDLVRRVAMEPLYHANGEQSDICESLADAITALRDERDILRSGLEATANHRAKVEAERDALRQLMLEARDWFHPRDPKVPGALVDMCDRIDAALKASG